MPGQQRRTGPGHSRGPRRGARDGLRVPEGGVGERLRVARHRADVTRVVPEGKLPEDIRLEPLKDLDGYFPWTPPTSPQAWQTRADQLRMQMRVALGIWPAPTKTPLRPVIHGKVDRDDYTVERVYFESMPGFFVTGSLYRPKKEGRHPAVLCPHGHWANGRFYEDSEANVKKTIEKGGEALIENGRVPLQARCATRFRQRTRL